MAAPTRTLRRVATPALVLLVVATYASARTLADDDGNRWKFEQLSGRFTYYYQSGFGYQSQAGPGERGSEALNVWSPSLLFRAKQNEKVEHNLAMPVDIISSASVDAIDVVTSASRVNETLTLDFKTQYAATDDDPATFRYGIHLEEWFLDSVGHAARLRPGRAPDRRLRVGAILGASGRGEVMIYIDPPGQFERQHIDLAFRRYWRTNDLRVDVISFGYDRLF